MFVLIIIGSAAFSGLVDSHIKPYFGLITAALAAVDLVFGLSVKARDHGFLREKYFEISAQIEEGRLNANEARAQMMRLSSKEEPPYYASLAVAENWAHLILYQTERTDVELSNFDRLTRNLFRHSNANFVKKR